MALFRAAERCNSSNILPSCPTDLQALSRECSVFYRFAYDSVGVYMVGALVTVVGVGSEGIFFSLASVNSIEYSVYRQNLSVLKDFVLAWIIAVIRRKNRNSCTVLLL